MLDYQTLILSLGVSGICLLLTFWSTWAARRSDAFLLTWVIGLTFLSSGIFGYALYGRYPRIWLEILCCCLMLGGLALLLAAARQFRTGEAPLGPARPLIGPAVLITAGPMVFGYDGVGLIGFNLSATALLLATAREYWRGRAEAHGPLISIAGLYSAVGLSFSLCAMMLVRGQHWTLGHAPDNWAETLNIAVSIAGMTGIGTMSMLIHQARITARHARDALTDSLTGLNNRRALFEQHSEMMCGPDQAVILFDIDRFKAVNDQYGHGGGDRALQAFAEELQRIAGPHATARLGGEEFAMIVTGIAPGQAEWLAERVRRSIQDRGIYEGLYRFQITVSAGICYGPVEGAPFETLLNLADNALYSAKRKGRNRVEVAFTASSRDRVIKSNPPA